MASHPASLSLFLASLFLHAHVYGASIERDRRAARVHTPPSLPAPPHLESLFAGVEHALHTTALQPSLLAVSKEQNRQSGTRLRYESCTSSSDCKQPLRCLERSFLDNQAIQCPSPSSTCFCVNPRMCISAEHCDEGEDCAVFNRIKQCVSIPILQQQGVTPVPSPTAEPEPVVFGVNFELCSTQSDCQGTRECIVKDRSTALYTNCSSQFVYCVCYDRTRLTACDSDADCPRGESCQTVRKLPMCLSAKAGFQAALVAITGATLPAEDLPPAAPEVGVCIAAHSLAHLVPEQLLFARARRARVLCDAARNCATAGHMVWYAGSPMMMKTYCARRGCAPAVLPVNSPRFRRALRVASNSSALWFTAVAARFESNAEERLLALALRVGLL